MLVETFSRKEGIEWKVFRWRWQSVDLGKYTVTLPSRKRGMKKASPKFFGKHKHALASGSCAEPKGVVSDMTDRGALDHCVSK
jgi:hypothetical protein